jgi:hypothetical protein
MGDNAIKSYPYKSTTTGIDRAFGKASFCNKNNISNQGGKKN